MRRGAWRRARAPVAAAAKVVNAFRPAGRHGRQAGDAGRDPVDQPMGEGAARCIGVDQLNGQFLGASWRRAPLQAGEPVRAVAGELAREPAPRQVRAYDPERAGSALIGTVHFWTSASDEREQPGERGGARLPHRSSWLNTPAWRG